MDEATKRCSRCQTIKYLRDFSRRTAMKDGHRSQCKSCDADDRATRADQTRAAKQVWREQNRERERASERARYARNAERERARKKTWALANPRRLREIKRRTREKYPEMSAVRARRWRAANPNADRLWRNANKESCRARLARYRARKAALAVTDFSAAQLAQRLSMFAGCWVCGGPKEEVDHVKPLNKGGAHMLANLRPICRSCNARKSDRWPYPLVRAA